MSRKGFKQGVYKPANDKKYKGTTPIIYRSSWELKWFRWADFNDKVLWWSSETVVIPYANPLTSKTSRYFVDGSMLYDHDGRTRKYLIEIKPFKQTQRPVPSKRKKKATIIYEQKTYIQNMAKWTAAKAWAKKKDHEFLILTEKELF